MKSPFKIIKKSSWQEVWEKWLQREKGAWEEIVHKRGYKNLADWRKDDSFAKRSVHRHWHNSERALGSFLKNP